MDTNIIKQTDNISDIPKCIDLKILHERLGLIDESEDKILLHLIRTAIELIEQKCNKTIIQKEFVYTVHARSVIYLPRSPVVKISCVQLGQMNSQTQEIDWNDVEFDVKMGNIWKVSIKNPDDLAVRVEYLAGGYTLSNTYLNAIYDLVILLYDSDGDKNNILDYIDSNAINQDTEYCSWRSM